MKISDYPRTGDYALIDSLDDSKVESELCIVNDVVVTSGDEGNVLSGMTVVAMRDCKTRYGNVKFHWVNLDKTNNPSPNGDFNGYVSAGTFGRVCVTFLQTASSLVSQNRY